MATVRKQLSDNQYNSLLESQVRVQNAEVAFQNAQAHSKQITSLVFEALNLPAGINAQLVTETKELVFDVPDQEDRVFENDSE